MVQLSKKIYSNIFDPKLIQATCTWVQWPKAAETPISLKSIINVLLAIFSCPGSSRPTLVTYSSVTDCYIDCVGFKAFQPS